MNIFSTTQFSGPSRLLAKLFLAVLLTSFFCVPAFSARPNERNEYSNTPAKGSLAWQMDQQKAKDRQELYRRRLALPDTSITPAQQITAADLTSPERSAVPLALKANRRWPQLFFIAAMFLVANLLFRKFNRELRVSPDTEMISPGNSPTQRGPTAEEKSLREFHDSFARALPSSAAPTNDNPLRGFALRASRRLSALHRLLEELRHGSGDVKNKTIINLCFEFSGIKAESSFPQARPVHQLAAAAEGLLKQVLQHPGSLTPSVMRTVAGGLDMLEKLCVAEMPPRLLSDQAFHFLVVDDDLKNRETTAQALHNAFGNSTQEMCELSDLSRANLPAGDVIFLTVRLPEAGGRDWCAKIRATENHAATPIVFVVDPSQFESQFEPILSDGNDLLARPFLNFEIALKALTLLFKMRLTPDGEKNFLPNTPGDFPMPLCQQPPNYSPQRLV